MIDPQLRATIRRLHYNQHLTINGVAEALGIHHETVRRAIVRNPVAREREVIRELEKFEAKVLETLSVYPKLSGVRVWSMIREQGYTGGLRAVQRWLHSLRPRVSVRVFKQMTMLPGEQAQVDWGHFGSLKVGKAVRKISAFVMVLSYSRAIFVRFTFDQTLESLLDCHVRAFNQFAGVPRTILYDNMKTVVVDRIGKEIRFHNDLLNFSSHYLFEPKACMPFQPQSKGRVERAIRFVRENFFMGRVIHEIDRLNAEVSDWCREVAGSRVWPEDSSYSVADRLEFERGCLLSLPLHPLVTSRHRVVRADPYGFVKFDQNCYSVPREAMGKSLILATRPDLVQILDGSNSLATHVRSWDKGEKIDDPSHLNERKKVTTPARVAPRAARLIELIPAIKQLLELGLEHDQSTTTGSVRWLEETLQIHGQQVLEDIIRQAVDDKIFTLDSLRSLLKTALNRESPDMILIVPQKKEVRDLSIRSHKLDTYDQL